ncbi:MAG: hypothetical protein K6356_15710 [Chloroflexus sp.]
MMYRCWHLCLFCLCSLLFLWACGGALPESVTAIPQPTPIAASPTATAPTTVPVALPTAVPTLAPTVLPPTVLAQPQLVAPSYPAEVFFTRNGALVALDPVSGKERVLATEARDLAIDASGQQIAVAYGQTLSVIDRRSGESRVIVSDRAVYGLSWTPDGLALAYAAAADPPLLPFDWERWSRWCGAATVYILDLPTANERAIGPGCDPVFASDGRRLAYATPPTGQVPFWPFPAQTNAIRLINRAGANAWNFAVADASPQQGTLVYAPAWSPNTREVAYQRFLGYQALVDVNLTMIADSSEGGGVPIFAGAGWHRRPTFAPDGQFLAMVEYNFSDARGFTGYDIWSLAIVTTQGERRELLPTGDVTLSGQVIAYLPRVVAVAWSPDGSALAALVPSGWDPNADRNQPLYPEATAGEIWELSAQGVPQRRLATLVDYASPLIWAPAGWATAQVESGMVMFPADWQVLPVTQAGELVATSNGRLVGRRTVVDLAGVDDTAWSWLVSDWVTVTDADAPYQLPDGSRLITFTGQAADGSTVAGVARIKANTIVVSYAPQAEWPRYRATGIALAMAAR